MSGETFETLLAPDFGRLRRLVHVHVRRSCDADDVLQEILVRAFARRNQLRMPTRFRTWLWTIALNQIRTFFRRERGVVSLDEFPMLDARDPAMSPLAIVERKERHEWFGAGLTQLSQRDQALIQMLDIEGRSLCDAAAALHISVSATKTAHFRARKRLAHTIGGRMRQHGRIPSRPED